MPQKILRAGAAPAALAVAVAIVAAALAAHPAPARAASARQTRGGRCRHRPPAPERRRGPPRDGRRARRRRRRRPLGRAGAPLRPRLARDRPRADRRGGAFAFRFQPREPGSAAVRVRAGDARRARRALERLPPRAGLVVRPRLLRRAPRLRRHAHARHARRGEQDAAVRHEGHAAPRRADRRASRSSTAARTPAGASSTSPRRRRTASASSGAGRSSSPIRSVGRAA